MTVPASLAALSTTASLNPPSGTDAVFPELDDHLRFSYSCLALLRNQKFDTSGGTLTGNVTVDIPGSGPGVFAQITMKTAASGWSIGTEGTGRFYVYNGVRDSINIPSTGEVQLYKPYRLDAATGPNELVRKQEMDAAIAAFPATPDATETAKGKAEIATQTETDTRTDDERIVTPKKLGNGLAFSIGSNGYLKFPSWMGGLMIQWGSVNITTGSGAATWAYPASFPNQVFVVLGTPNGLVSEPVCVLAQNTAQAIVDFGSSSNTSNCFMFAIGN